MTLAFRVIFWLVMTQHHLVELSTENKTTQLLVTLHCHEQIFPEYMKDAGYETHMIGKWHLGSYTQDVIPSRRGFDTFMGYLNGEEMYWTHQVRAFGIAWGSQTCTQPVLINPQLANEYSAR